MRWSWRPKLGWRVRTDGQLERKNELERRDGLLELNSVGWLVLSSYGELGLQQLMCGGQLERESSYGELEQRTVELLVQNSAEQLERESSYAELELRTVELLVQHRRRSSRQVESMRSWEKHSRW